MSGDTRSAGQAVALVPDISDEDRARKWLSNYLDIQEGQHVEPFEGDTLSLVALLGTVRDDERERCARRLCELGERAAGNFLRIIPEHPIPLSRKEIEYAKSVAKTIVNRLLHRKEPSTE